MNISQHAHNMTHGHAQERHRDDGLTRQPGYHLRRAVPDAAELTAFDD